jgi:hypothetical protein
MDLERVPALSDGRGQMPHANPVEVFGFPSEHDRPEPSDDFPGLDTERGRVWNRDGYAELRGVSSAGPPKHRRPRRQMLSTPVVLPQHPHQHRSEGPVLLAVDQELGEGTSSSRLQSDYLSRLRALALRDELIYGVCGTNAVDRYVQGAIWTERDPVRVVQALIWSNYIRGR